MNASDWNVLAVNASGNGRIIIGRDNPLIFVGRAHKQTRKSKIGPPPQSPCCFGIQIDAHRDRLQFAFRLGQRGLCGIDRHG